MRSLTMEALTWSGKKNGHGPSHYCVFCAILWKRFHLVNLAV